ncbi:hypothetical protein [Bacillus sp. X1(2014)]|nr:hypothetical protein [Bacillus sp. X1(2014)]
MNAIDVKFQNNRLAELTLASLFDLLGLVTTVIILEVIKKYLLNGEINDA